MSDNFDYGTIKSISECDDDNVLGYIVETENSRIKVTIDNFSSCCEEYGKRLLHSLTDSDEFIGAQVTSVGWGKDKVTTDPEDASAVVAIQTSKGLLEVEVYNYHNGYYPHTVEVEWHGYSDSQEI